MKNTSFWELFGLNSPLTYQKCNLALLYKREKRVSVFDLPDSKTLPGIPKPIPRSLQRVVLTYQTLLRGPFLAPDRHLKLPMQNFAVYESFSAVFIKNRPNPDISSFDR